MSKSLVIAISVVCFVLFAILSKYEDRNILRGVDFAATVKIQEKIDNSSRLRTAALVGNIMEGSSFFASPEFTVVITLLGSGVLLYNKKRKKFSPMALLVPVLLMVLVGAEVVGKSMVHHPSPPFSMVKNPTTIFPANYINEQYSYPSGHAARAVFLAFLTLTAFAPMTKLTQKKGLFIGAALCVYVLLVSVSKVYLGHHWMSDVIGGMLLGAAFGVLVMLIRSDQENDEKTVV